MLSRTKRTVWWILTTAAIGLLCSVEAQAKKPPKPPDDDGSAGYSIVPFMPPALESEASQVTDLNETGHAVGFAELDGTAAGDRAVHLDIATGEYTVLEGASSFSGVNNLNQIAGRTLNGEHYLGAFWNGPSAAPVDLPPLPGGTQGWARAINDAGIIVGISKDDSLEGGGVIWRVFVDQGGVDVHGPLPLPPLDGDVATWGSDLNELIDGAFQVSGYSRGEDGDRAVVWTVGINDDGTLAPPGPPVSLGTLGLSDPSRSLGYAINIVGDVCGSSDGMPFVAPAGQAAQPLPVPRNTLFGYAFDINNLGEIVGKLTLLIKGGRIDASYAYLWKDGDMINLEKQIDRKSGWGRLWGASVINDAGSIAGYGRFDVERRGFLLIPSEP